MNTKKTVIFVHGFGVMKDARGMFTEISDALSSRSINCILFDLNTLDADGNIALNTLNEQVQILKKIHAENSEGSVDLICHSLGCVVATLADLPHIRKTIFLAPPIENDYSKSVEYFSRNPLTTIDMNGTSRLARRDGTFTLVPPEYWLERKSLNFKELYGKYIAHNDVYVVKASLDELISNEETETIFKGANLLELESDHDFKDVARPLLVSLCEKLVTR